MLIFPAHDVAGGFAFAISAPISCLMKYLLLIAPLLTALAQPLHAQDDTPVPPLAEAWAAEPTQVFDAADVTLDELKWIARPIVVFAESPFDPLFQQQMQLIADRADDLALRDVIVITDTDPDARTELRQRLRPRAFMLTLIGKDGQVKLRKPSPWDVREISRSIDKMPLRQQEIRDRRGLDE